MSKQVEKSAASSAATKGDAPARGTTPTPVKYDFPLTTMRDVEQNTYTAERAEQLRQGNVSYTA